MLDRCVKLAEVLHEFKRFGLTGKSNKILSHFLFSVVVSFKLVQLCVENPNSLIITI